MRRRRRIHQCIYCGHTTGEIYTYCPPCGQENKDQNISFGLLSRDFLQNYFSPDSKFRNSLGPFILLPGHITNEFNKGERVSGSNSIRLDLIMSGLYFYVLCVMLWGILLVLF